MRNWFKNQLTALAIATSRVEKYATSQNIDLDDMSMTQNINKGTLMNSIVNGEITEEVENLRWRSMLIEAAIEAKKDYKSILASITLDDDDDYKLKLVIGESNVESGLSDMDINEEVSDYSYEENKLNNTLNKNYNIGREVIPRFKFEDFVNKINIREKSIDDVLIEFYCPQLTDGYNRTKRLFLKEIERNLIRGKYGDLFTINEFEFITLNVLGAPNYHHYKFGDIKFDKVVTFGNNYVIKFKCKPIINGEYILEKYRSKELDIKYKNKEKK